MMSKVQCLFCFETCTTEGRGGEKGGSAKSKTKHTEPLTSQMPRPLYAALLNVFRGRPPPTRVHIGIPI